MTEWTVKPQKLFWLFMPEEGETPRLHGYILVKATPDGPVEDSFQVCVRGEQGIRIEFPAANITNLQPLQPYHFLLDTKPEEIFFNDNQTVSSWLDVRDLVHRRSLLVTKNGKEANEEFSCLLQVTIHKEQSKI
jgi:hypothetical protein